MIPILMFVHLLLCFLAIGFGSLTLFDLLSRRFIFVHLIWFMRCSLWSSLSALFVGGLHQLLPAQQVAMLVIYAAGLVILAWRAFHLRGAWRPTFGFAIALLLYLNILSISIQILGVAVEHWFHFQVALLFATLAIGSFVAKRLSGTTTPALVQKTTVGAGVARH